MHFDFDSERAKTCGHVIDGAARWRFERDAHGAGNVPAILDDTEVIGCVVECTAGRRDAPGRSLVAFALHRAEYRQERIIECRCGGAVANARIDVIED